MGCSESRISDKSWSDTKKTSESEPGSSNSSENHQYTLYESIEKNDLQSVSKIVEQGFDVNYQMPSFYQRTPLHIACQIGSINAVELLLSKGADSEIEDSYGISPRFLASLKENKTCADKLNEVLNKPKLMALKTTKTLSSPPTVKYNKRLSVL